MQMPSFVNQKVGRPINAGTGNYDDLSINPLSLVEFVLRQSGPAPGKDFQGVWQKGARTYRSASPNSGVFSIPCGFIYTKPKLFF
jgi:hypothetical protein